jgi:MoxR-like ATPase
MKIEAVADRCQEILAALGQVIVGKADVLDQLLAGLLANGHILIEDVPGLAKTLIARLVAQSLDLGFKRIQFTPDLLPSDITGSFLFDQRQARFEFRPGPIFTNLLLADEINRATPKTQSALLEAMQESQVTVEGERFPLEPPFLVIATQNPIELEGTYPLPEAQLDRFLMRLAVGYPGADDEVEILAPSRPWPRARSSLKCRRAWRTSTSLPSSSAISWTWCRPRGPISAWPSAPRPAGRSPSSSWPGPWPRSAGGTSCSRTT